MIIALDGASTDLSVALVGGDGTSIAEEAWSSPQRQSAELLPRLLGALDAAGRRLDEATAVAVGTGPGSFTGLRVAMALAKGLALGLRRPIVGVPSLEAWLETEPQAVAAVARAGAQEAYVLLRGEADPALSDRGALMGRLAGRRIVAPAELVHAFGLADAVSPRGAGAIASRAIARLRDDPSGDDLRRLEPRYLRAPRGIGDGGGDLVRWR